MIKNFTKMIKKFYKIIKNLVVEVTDFGTLTVINARFLAGCIFCHNWSKFLQGHKCYSDSRIYRSKSSKKTLFRGYVDRELLMSTTYCFDTFFLRNVQNLHQNFTQFYPTLLRLDFQKFAPKCPFSSCFK